MTVAEELTRQFYAWELRGRGWQVWPEPVDLEPPFRPFWRYLPEMEAVDDGRIPSWWERFARVLTLSNSRLLPTVPAVGSEYEVVEAPAPVVGEAEELCALQVVLPPNFEPLKGGASQLLLALTSCRDVVSFELIGTPQAIVVQFVCRAGDRISLRQQIESFFPDAVVTAQDDQLLQQADKSLAWTVVDFGLSQEFVRPLHSLAQIPVDPLVTLCGAMGELDDGEMAVIQILFQPTTWPWAESIFRAVTDCEGDSFFVDAPEMVALARDKIRYPLFATVVRTAAQGSTLGRCWQITRHLGSGLAQMADPISNELIPLSNDEYDDSDHLIDLFLRRSRRSGMILNAAELATLVHLPSADVRNEKLHRLTVASKAVPSIAVGHATILGRNVHRGRTATVSLNVDQRLQHLHVVGASGTGKSTLLVNLICQDMEQGHGVVVLDPHGDLIDAVVGQVPERRLDQVILFDPGDEEFPVGFNILNAHSALEKNLLASDLVAVFARLSTSWGDQMTTVLANAILAMLESSRGGTIVDLRRFLVEPAYRQAFLESVTDQQVVYYWQREFPLLSGRPQGPILTRLDAFLRTKCLRLMVSQKTSALDFSRLMRERGIFLAKLSHGIIGAENASLLGSLLIAKLGQAAFGRQSLAPSERKPCFAYLDEFHNFVTPSMVPLLTGGRKYGIGLVMAHQELYQLERGLPEVASAVLGNTATRVCFRVAEADARKLAEGYVSFATKDFLNLTRGEALIRVAQASNDCNLSTFNQPAVPPTVAESRRQRIVDWTRENYARGREDIEREFAASMAEPERRSSEDKTSQRAAKPSATQAIATPKASPIAPTPRPKQSHPSTPAPMGKGGTQHKYLQQFIKRWAEGMGYRATIEKPLADGASVDVALEKDARSIACEISVSTTPAHEVGNLEKCLNAGFTDVAVIASDKKKLADLELAARNRLTVEQLARLQFVTPEELFGFIEQLEAQSASKEKTVRGYRVKVSYGAPAAGEKQARTRAVSQVIAKALKRIGRSNLS